MSAQRRQAEVAGWDMVPLGKLLTRVRKPVQLEPDRLYREIGIRSHGKGIFYKQKVTGASLGNKAVFWVEPDCLIVNIVFAWEQAIARTTSAEEGMVASHRFPMYRPKKGLLDLDFLVYFFKTPYGKYLLGLASPGGAGRNKTLGQAEFQRLRIPVPPLAVQRRIARMLGAWDEAITLTQRLIDARQRRKRALMKQVLAGKWRFRAFQGRDWREARLADYIRTCKNGFGRRPQGSEDGPVVLRLADVSQGFINLSSPRRVAMSPEEFQTYRLMEGDLVFIRVNGSPDCVAKCVLVDRAYDDLAFNDHLMRVRLTPGLSSRYLHQLLLYEPIHTRLLAFVPASPGGQLTINQTSLSSLKIPLPPLEEQSRIAEVLCLCDQDIDLLVRRLALLREQKRGLMQRFMTGHTRVEGHLDGYGPNR